MLLVEADEPRVRQGEGGVARLHLLEDVVLVALVIELDLVELVLQVLAEGAGQAPGVLVDADVDRLPHLAFHREVRLLVHAQGRELRRPSRQGPHLVGRPAALAADRGGVRAVDAQRSLVADEPPHHRRRRDRHPPLQAPPPAFSQAGLAAHSLAHLLPPLRPVEVAVPHLEIALQGQGEGQAVVEPGRPRLIVGPSGVDGHLLAGEGSARLHQGRGRGPRAQQRRPGAEGAVLRRIVEDPMDGGPGRGLEADPRPGRKRGEDESAQERAPKGEAGAREGTGGRPRNGGIGYGHGQAAGPLPPVAGGAGPWKRGRPAGGCRGGLGCPAGSAAPRGDLRPGALEADLRVGGRDGAITLWEPTGGAGIRQSEKPPRRRTAAPAGASESRSCHAAGGAAAGRRRPVTAGAHTGDTHGTRIGPPPRPGRVLSTGL